MKKEDLKSHCKFFERSTIEDQDFFNLDFIIDDNRPTLKQFVIHIWPKEIQLKILKESTQTLLNNLHSTHIHKETIQCPYSLEIDAK